MPRPPPPGRAKTRLPGFTARCDGSMVPQKAPHESLEFLNVSDLQTKPPRMSEKKMSCSHISPSCCHCWIGHVLDSIEVTSWQYRPSEQSYILLFTHSLCVPVGGFSASNWRPANKILVTESVTWRWGILLPVDCPASKHGDLGVGSKWDSDSPCWLQW